MLVNIITLHQTLVLSACIINFKIKKDEKYIQFK